ncbi:transposase [Thalassospira xiamenensis]|uniref:transposase n=1 Tax=Thalassospira xiamenensis TaxID=220697 RepID=UPI003AA9713D
MSDLFWLSRSRFLLIEPYFPRAKRVPHVDDQRVVSGITHVIRKGLRWHDAPREYRPHTAPQKQYHAHVILPKAL